MNRAELAKTLELVKPALATTNMVPIFQCFILSEGHVSAYNDTIAIVGPCEYDWACGIHGNTLLGLLSNSKAEEVEISLERDTVTLKMGKSVSKLPFQPHENFIFEEPDEKFLRHIPFTESLADAIKMGLETVSVDATQAALLGVSIMGDTLYSCDGDALTRIKLTKGIKGRVLMPTPFCEAVVRLWASLSMTKGTLYFSDDWVFADLGDWKVYGRVLEITDPIDFADLIKKNIKAEVETLEVPEGFSEALSRARVLADPESQKTKVTVSKGKLTLLTETHMGEIKDELPIKHHPDVTSNINANHIQKALNHCDQIAFLDNCTVLERLPDVLLLVSNMG